MTFQFARRLLTASDFRLLESKLKTGRNGDSPPSTRKAGTDETNGKTTINDIGGHTMNVYEVITK